MTRTEYKSETGKLTHIRKNTFSYGQVIVTKYLGGYCTAQLGNAMSWEEDSEAALIARLDAAGYGK